MKVTTKDVEYIAQLSRLTIPEGEMEKFTEQALKNAPTVHNGGFKVPRVIE